MVASTEVENNGSSLVTNVVCDLECVFGLSDMYIYESRYFPKSRDFHKIGLPILKAL